METSVYADATATERLQQLGLTADILIQAVIEGQLARETCTENDPALIPGVLFWGRMNRSLREQLIPLGWFKKNDRGQPLTLNPEGDLAIVAFAGDDATGISGRVPQPKNPKGAATLAAVKRNERQLSLFPGDQALHSVEICPLTWVLLVNRVGAELRAELSLPQGIGVDGLVMSWAERILLTAIPLGDEEVLSVVDDGQPVEVEVVRKTQ